MTSVKELYETAVRVRSHGSNVAGYNHLRRFLSTVLCFIETYG